MGRNNHIVLFTAILVFFGNAYLMFRLYHKDSPKPRRPGFLPDPDDAHHQAVNGKGAARVTARPTKKAQEDEFWDEKARLANDADYTPLLVVVWPSHPRTGNLIHTITSILDQLPLPRNDPHRGKTRVAVFATRYDGEMRPSLQAAKDHFKHHKKKKYLQFIERKRPHVPKPYGTASSSGPSASERAVTMDFVAMLRAVSDRATHVLLVENNMYACASMVSFAHYALEKTLIFEPEFISLSTGLGLTGLLLPAKDLDHLASFLHTAALSTKLIPAVDMWLKNTGSAQMTQYTLGRTMAAYQWSLFESLSARPSPTPLAVNGTSINATNALPSPSPAPRKKGKKGKQDGEKDKDVVHPILCGDPVRGLDNRQLYDRGCIGEQDVSPCPEHSQTDTAKNHPNTGTTTDPNPDGLQSPLAGGSISIPPIRPSLDKAVPAKRTRPPLSPAAALRLKQNGGEGIDSGQGWHAVKSIDTNWDCNKVCRKKKSTCDPHAFKEINTCKLMMSHVTCTQCTGQVGAHLPALKPVAGSQNEFVCLYNSRINQDPRSSVCNTKHRSHLRMCPCRGQGPAPIQEGEDEKEYWMQVARQRKDAEAKAALEAAKRKGKHGRSKVTRTGGDGGGDDDDDDMTGNKHQPAMFLDNGMDVTNDEAVLRPLQ